MTDDNIGPIIGAGLGLVAGLYVAKTAIDLVDETGKKAKSSKKTKTRRSSTDDKIRYMLGK